MHMPRLAAFLFLCFAAISTCKADSAAELLFVRRVVPLFAEKCQACHGGDPQQIEGGFDLGSLAGLLKGGDSEVPAIVPGKPEESPLILASERTHGDWSPMPPKEAERLTTAQIDWIKEWIRAGAPWPSRARQRKIAAANENLWSAEDGVVVKTAGGLSPEWTNRKYEPAGLWAYQPVRKPVIPAYAGASQQPQPIDALIAAAMPAGLNVAPAADARAFIRRASFDLTGLPPTPEEASQFERHFVADPDAAVKALIERLLNSPHYGERMAQHWLDVTRYADSSGFANDFERGNAWRYRDYVVRSFNADKPYDSFIREQIAGDELDPDNAEMLIATGFLRMGPWELTGMEVAKVARQRFLDDVTNSVGETFLAHSLQCARCHDHKFDPIPTHDYYALQACFATTQLSERAAPFLKQENTQGFEEKKFLEALRQEHVAVLKRLDEQLLQSAQKWFVERKRDPSRWNAALAEVQAGNPSAKGKRREYQEYFAAARSLLMKQGVPEDQFPPKLFGFTPEDYGSERVARKGLERLRWELDRYEPFALSVYNGATPQVPSVLSPVRMPSDRLSNGELEQTAILAGGDPFSPTAQVQPGVLSILVSASRTLIPPDIDGRRTALANWISSSENPLTTRTIVNRIWLWHFGQPIAGNPNNFGSTGKKPTHPALLDWLAATFVERGWSIKELHRAIMTSQAYRRSAVHPDRDSLLKLDPLGVSYAVFQPRRLSAEELRDAMLTATGELNPTIGGIPNRPEINLEAALQPRQVMGTFASAWTPNPLPAQRHRRSLYALKLRGLTDPLLEVFNSPTPDFSCERRESSTVTPQVFSLFNGQATHSRALALANRVLTESKADNVRNADEQVVDRLFKIVFSRAPLDAELQACVSHWHETIPLVQLAPEFRPLPLQVRREAVEENTGEKFSFNETLHANADFVPDLQPANVDARTRALADVCLVLFNSNEFAYVY